MDQYAKDRADIDQLHKDLEHQVGILIADNERLRAALQQILDGTNERGLLIGSGAMQEIAESALNQQRTPKDG